MTCDQCEGKVVLTKAEAEWIYVALMACKRGQCDRFTTAGAIERIEVLLSTPQPAQVEHPYVAPTECYVVQSEHKFKRSNVCDNCGRSREDVAKDPSLRWCVKP